MDSYKLGSFSSWKSWRSEDTKKQNKIIGYILMGLCISAIVLIVLFLI